MSTVEESTNLLGELAGNLRRLSSPGQSSNPGSRRMSTLCPSSAGLGARRLSALVPESVVRRLSNVSTSLGLNKPQPQECYIDQGKTLCALYMKSRMRACGGTVAVPSNKTGKRERIAPSWAGARIVFPRLSQLGRHLERARPRLYAAVAKHAIRTKANNPPTPAHHHFEPNTDSTGVLHDPADIVYALGTELFKNDITWGKIVSLMAICGALACEPKLSTEFTSLVEAVAAVIRTYLMPWLNDHGGWYGLVEYGLPMEHAVENQSGFSSNSILAGCIALILLLGFMWLLFNKTPT